MTQPTAPRVNPMRGRVVRRGDGVASAGNVATVGDLGVKSVCVVEPRTTPPSSTVVVLLSGDRLYRATGWYALSCDTLRQFAAVAVRRIGA